MMSGVSIIIPVYNALDYARECLDRVYRAGGSVPFEVIVVNNGSRGDVGEWLRSEQKRRQSLTVLSYDRPLGFARAVNEGAQRARYDVLILLNSDCFVTNGWLDGLLETLEADERIGIASPVTDQCGPGAQLVSGPPPANVRQPLIEEPRRLFFFCAMIRRKLWDSLGGLDEAYGVGTYEDDDFCLRARLAGWSLAVDPNVFVFNHASKTFNENGIDHDDWLFRNKKIFLEKASQLSRLVSCAAHAKKTIASTTVVVACADGAADKLIHSLASLANQTVTGFETLIVSAERRAFPDIPDELLKRLGMRYVSAGPGSLWNVGIAAAQTEFIAYLPAGDIYFPYHLETLHQSLAANACDAAYTCWSVAIHSAAGIDRASVYPGNPERLLMADWAPLFCWMHRRSCLPRNGFREDLSSFREWEFVLRLRKACKVKFEADLTCERNRECDDSLETTQDAQFVMEAFPVT
ncbi:MAG: glycosyltransferase, partial [Acidobacteriaceae bacterium]|nr:glycosyltransferase [Acidobacteriaceae bacterium]